MLQGTGARKLELPTVDQVMLVTYYLKYTNLPTQQHALFS